MKHAIPCRSGDRSNVNKHLKNDHCISSERKVFSRGKGSERVEEDGCVAADFARPHFFDAEERERCVYKYCDSKQYYDLPSCGHVIFLYSVLSIGTSTQQQYII